MTANALQMLAGSNLPRDCQLGKFVYFEVFWQNSRNEYAGRKLETATEGVFEGLVDSISSAMTQEAPIRIATGKMLSHAQRQARYDPDLFFYLRTDTFPILRDFQPYLETARKVHLEGWPTSARVAAANRAYRVIERLETFCTEIPAPNDNAHVWHDFAVQELAQHGMTGHLTFNEDYWVAKNDAETGLFFVSREPKNLVHIKLVLT
jgi:hypothetical protein